MTKCYPSIKNSSQPNGDLDNSCDPLFFTDSVFLKSPERIEALALLMGLCLLVYTLAQRQLRQTLLQSQSGIKNQLGKLTSRPTLRWIFQCFQSVHLLMIQGVKQISNLTPERLEILRFFSPACRRYYLLLWNNCSALDRPPPKFRLKLAIWTTFCWPLLIMRC